MRATPVSPAVILLEKSGTEQESLVVQQGYETVRGTVGVEEIE